MSHNNKGSKRRKIGGTEEVDEEKEEKELQIPTDLYEEILLLLSTKHLLICKRVCKAWHKLISDPRFIQTHLYRSKAGCCNNGIRILIPMQSDIIEYCYYNYSDGDNISKKIPYPLGFSGKSIRILGSCDGLICLVERESCKLDMFNSSTGNSVTRTVDGIKFERLSFYWFGYHPSCGEYVIILGYFGERDVKVVVYKFSCNLKPVMHCSIGHNRLVFCWEKIPVLLHGNLHWPAISSNANDNNPECKVIILKYDLHKDKIVEIPVPEQCFFQIGVMDGCLFAISNRNELWIMKEYGSNNLGQNIPT